MSIRMALTAATVQCLLMCTTPAAASGSGDSLLVTSSTRLIISADVDSSAIFIDGLVAGVTPLTLDTVSAGTHTLVVVSRSPASWFAKTDSLTVVLMPGETRHLKFSVVSPLRLEPATLPGASSLLRSNTGQNGRTIALYTSGGIAIAAGIAAAYFKISADGRNDAYVLTGNPALLDERRRLDTAAGIAFVATQIGFAVFSYLLLAE
jgi:PEGA domain